jgi:hypothetical protein
MREKKEPSQLLWRRTLVNKGGRMGDGSINDDDATPLGITTTRKFNQIHLK